MGDFTKMGKTKSKRKLQKIENKSLSREEIGKRLRAIRGERTLEEMREWLGNTVSISNIAQCEKGINKPSAILLSALANLQVNVNWVLTGRGRPYLTGEQPFTITEDKSSYLIQIPKTGLAEPGRVLPGLEDCVEVPLMTVEAAAGEPRVVEDEVEALLPIPKTLLPRGAYRQQLSAVRIKGDSMAPLLPDGSIAVINHSLTDTNRLRRRIIAARIPDTDPPEVTIKYLDWSEGYFNLMPHNPKYPPIPIPKNHPAVENLIIGTIILSVSNR